MSKRQGKEKTKVANGRISIQATVPPIQGAFRFLDGGGARITLDLEPESADKYWQLMKLANRQLLTVIGELGLE